MRYVVDQEGLHSSEIWSWIGRGTGGAEESGLHITKNITFYISARVPRTTDFKSSRVFFRCPSITPLAVSISAICINCLGVDHSHDMAKM